MQQNNLSKNVFDTQEILSPSPIGGSVVLPQKDTFAPFVELDRPSSFELRKPSFDGRQIATATIVNRTVNKFSKTYDAIVNASGGADFTSLEKAIEYVVAIGGGDIFVWGGTYTPSSAMTITKPINIVGQNSALTIINFNSTTRNFIINSGTAYTTGTISSIAADRVTVTGSSTAWLANVTAGQYMFLGTRWYLIAAVTANTTIILAETYVDNIALSAYRIATLTRNVSFEGLTIKNSTGTAIAATDCRDFFLKDIVLVTNNKALVLTNVAQIDLNLVVAAGSTSNGIEFTNCGLGGGSSVAIIGNGAIGLVYNNVKTMEFEGCAISANTGDGLNITSGNLLGFDTMQFFANGGEGAEVVATSNRVSFSNCDFDSNTLDGLKLTATADYCKVIGNHFDTNGAYAVNIAAATCDKNIVSSNSFNLNVSGTISNSGTGTVVNGDNTT